jgi:hypothetical protein
MKGVELTIFRSANGILSKRISLIEGEVKSDGSACKMVKGTAWRATIKDIDALADLIENMRSEQALALGRLRDDLPDEVSVTLARKLNGKAAPDTIARTTDYLHFAAGAPAFMLLDYDRKGQPPEVAEAMRKHGGFWPAVTSVVPELAEAARVVRCSTSSWLYHRDAADDDDWLTRVRGRHVYLAVSDGSDIERATKTLHDRLWLAGLGYYLIGASGQLLDHSIIDRSVYGPERLVFEGVPTLVRPIKQDHEQRRAKVYDGDFIDTRSVIPDLTETEKATVAKLKAAARDRLKPQAEEVRKQWAREFAPRHGMSEAEAKRIAADASNYILRPEFELEFDELGCCTVADVLANADEYVGQALADPLEGVAYGRGKAKVFRQSKDRLLMIHSFAHGGINYKLEGQGVGVDDFFAYMERHNYIYTPTRQPWPATSVNARISPVALTDADGQPVLDNKGNPKFISASEWLDQHRAVEQITWAPGEPMLITDRLIADGGWIKHNGVQCLNLYRPPIIKLGDPRKARPWLDHLVKIYPGDADHIACWLAQRVQRPAEKINHALVLGGAQGIGKDTLLEPVKRAVGNWNFQEVSPSATLGRFNGFLKAVILRISEARDLGEYDRYKFYDHAKVYTAAPPDVLRIDEKNLREHYIPNCCGVIITTNHKTDGIYLPDDDRRHYVVWSEFTKEDFPTEYWQSLWGWYEHGGYEHVAAFLNETDISDFDPKAPPPKTDAFLAIVDAGRAPEDAELADVLDDLGNPDAVTLDEVIEKAGGDFQEWLRDRRNRRQIPHRLEACGYVKVRNEAVEDGMFHFNGRRRAIYVRAKLTRKQRKVVVQELLRGG